MIVEILLGILALVFLCALYIKYVKWTYFEKRGILQMPTAFPLGNFNEMIYKVRLTLFGPIL